MKNIENWFIGAMLCCLAVSFGINTCQAAAVVNLDDSLAPPVKIISLAQWKSEHATAKDLTPAVLTFPQFGGEHVVIASLVASASPNLTQSYINARGGIFGYAVSTDRTDNPPAWYLVPANGWQWFDFVTTTGFNSWLGSAALTNNATMGEFGHRFVIHELGRYPANDYWLTVSSSVTNIPTTTLNVATNSTTGAEIAFNSNFIGINYGPNGVLDSFYDPSSGAIVVGGDDTVFTSGLPSQSTYTAWWRFGSTVSVTVSSTAGFNPIKDQFAEANQWFTATLSKNGTSVASETVTAATPSLAIVALNPTKTQLAVTIQGAQLDLGYQLLTTTSLTPPEVWSQVYPNQTFYNGTAIMVTNDVPKRFFRVRAVAP
jgi:hypothetical protein